jgi:hypothetical protein
MQGDILRKIKSYVLPWQETTQERKKKDYAWSIWSILVYSGIDR